MTDREDNHEFHLPTRPYSPIDELNRRSAAMGSVRYATLTSHANYNGHHVSAYWNDYRKYYVADYTWAGRVVLARGKAEQCTAAAIAEYDRGALGASVAVHLRGEDVERVLLQFPQLVPGCEPRPEWRTWRHQCAGEAARDAANPRLSVLLFDWDLMQQANSRDEYIEALRTKHGRVYT